MELINERVLIFLKNGFKATGTIIEQTEKFVTIYDEISKGKRIISFDVISEIQYLKDKGGYENGKQNG